jgi:hypothetical protein
MVGGLRVAKREGVHLLYFFCDAAGGQRRHPEGNSRLPYHLLSDWAETLRGSIEVEKV